MMEFWSYIFRQSLEIFGIQCFRATFRWRRPRVWVHLYSN